MIARLLPFAIALCVASPCLAQQTTYSVPVTTTSDSFFESFGVNWGFQRSSPNGGMFFRFGSPNAAVPPFGGFTPQAGANLGFGTRGGGGSSFFNFSAAQGSRRVVTSSVPSLTVMNGAVGSIQSGTVRPFVTGFAPVVGGRVTSPLKERLERLKYEKPGPRMSTPSSNTPPRRVYPSRRTQPRSSAETTDASVFEIRAAVR